MEVTLSLPEVDNSYKYKDNVRQIEELVRCLNSLTANLQDKVNTMLKGQQTEFVNSYKQHMLKIEEALKDYQRKIADYQKKIEHYENQGVLAVLLKKIQFLEENEKKLLKNHERKDKIILTLKGEVSTQQREILSLQARVKELLATPPQSSSPAKIEPTFPTEVGTARHATLKSSLSMEYSRNTSPQFLTIANPQQRKQELTFEAGELKRVNRQLSVLKRRHRELSSINSKILEKTSSMESFFVKVVQDLKRKINGRKKFHPCTLDDFKQEDKLELLVKVLSNQEVLQHLYSKIFSPQSQRTPPPDKDLALLPRTQKVVTGRLPAISARRADS